MAQILVPFEGEDSGVGELSWGQREIWLAMQHQRSSLGIGGVFPLPRGTATGDVTADLRFLMGRHQSLRTRLVFGPDGAPRQLLAKSGEVPLEVVDASDGDPAEIAERVYRRYAEQLFDYASEWPIRWAVITRQGEVTHLVSEVCHLAADGGGLLAMAADLKARDPVTGLAERPLSGMPPLDQTRWQGTAAGQRQSNAALRHWARLLRAIPARRFTAAAAPRRPRYWQVHYDSPATHLALRAISARTGADSPTILLAAFAVALCRVTGNNPVVTQVVVSNRFRPGLADTVSPVNQTGLCVIDLAGITFAESVARAWRAAMGAYKHAYYDPLRQQEMIAAVERERGEEIDIACFVNDRRFAGPREPAGPGPLPSAKELRAAVARSTLTWGYQQDRPSERLFFHINDVPGTASLEICADTRYVPPADMEAVLRGLEAVAVAAALDPAAPTGILPALVPA